jgi:hypothetical protein
MPQISILKNPENIALKHSSAAGETFDIRETKRIKASEELIDSSVSTHSTTLEPHLFPNDTTHNIALIILDQVSKMREIGLNLRQIQVMTSFILNFIRHLIRH